jgi:hypothetical protein
LFIHDLLQTYFSLSVYCYRTSQVSKNELVSGITVVVLSENLK